MPFLKHSVLWIACTRTLTSFIFVVNFSSTLLAVFLLPSNSVANVSAVNPWSAKRQHYRHLWSVKRRQLMLRSLVANLKTFICHSLAYATPALFLTISNKKGRYCILLFENFLIIFYCVACIACIVVWPRESCLSVRLSLSQTCDLWQSERRLCAHSYTTQKVIYPSFVTRRMVGGERPSLIFWVKLIQLERKRRFSIDIRAKKNSINTNRKSAMRFSMSIR